MRYGLLELDQSSALLSCVALQSRDVPVSPPDIKVVPIEQLGRLLFGFAVIGAIQLVHAGNAPLIVEDIGAVVHGSRSPDGTIIPRPECQKSELGGCEELGRRGSLRTVMGRNRLWSNVGNREQRS